MKDYAWNQNKNIELIKIRQISFEQVLLCLEEGRVLDILEHPNKKQYPNQQYYIININDYAYVVPFVEDEEKIFLKTIIPSRKYTRKYLLRGGKNEG